MKRLLIILFSSLVLIATIFIVEDYVGWRTIGVSLSAIPAWSLWFLIPLSLLSYLFRSVRVAISLDIPLTHLLNVFRISALHNLLNILLPMRTGEVSFPLLMRKNFDLSLVTTSTHLIIFRLLDLLTLISIGLLSLTYQFNPYYAMVLFAVLSVSFIALQPVKLTMAKWIENSNVRLFVRVSEALKIAVSSPTKFYYVCVLTLLTWLAKLAAFVLFCVFCSGIEPLAALISIVVADLSSVLPIHGIAGSGTFEAAFVLGGQINHIDNMELLAIAVQLHLFLIAAALFTYALSQCVCFVTSKSQPSQIYKDTL